MKVNNISRRKMELVEVLLAFAVAKFDLRLFACNVAVNFL
jgi:hypothetical protein